MPATPHMKESPIVTNANLGLQPSAEGATMGAPESRVLVIATGGFAFIDVKKCYSTICLKVHDQKIEN